MYPDPKRVRNNRLTIRLDDYEYALFKAIADQYGEQVSSYIREAAIQHVVDLLGLEEAQRLTERVA